MLSNGFINGGNQADNQIMNGVYSGIVTDNKDPDQLGRVKVKIPIIDNEKDFDWVRIVSFMGGKERGALFIPEVGDEVLVAFMMGSISAPVVIGCLWNKESKPPEGKNNENDIRKVKTRSGHELIFDDKKDQGKVTLKTSGGHTLEMLDKEKKIVVETSDHNNLMTLDQQKGEVIIKASSTTVTLKKNGELEIKAPNAVKISGGQIKIEASSMLELKANANVSISASGMLQLKGSMIKLN